jgi:hypothetical protein
MGGRKGPGIRNLARAAKWQQISRRRPLSDGAARVLLWVLLRVALLCSAMTFKQRLGSFGHPEFWLGRGALAIKPSHSYHMDQSFGDRKSRL